MRSSVVVSTSLLLALCACGGGSSADAGSDASTGDAGVDLGRVDAGTDLGTSDAGIDLGIVDSGSDLGPTDAGDDAGRDAMPPDGAAPCATDADCHAGTEWCVSGACVPCDNSGLACDIACIHGWATYTRNGCFPCTCAPVNHCTHDSDCGGGQTCFAGRFCWDYCPADDPTCCFGNTCADPACGGPPPVGCWTRGCPVGMSCGDTGCASSTCSCGGGPPGAWGCSGDCGGGTCT